MKRLAILLGMMAVALFVAQQAMAETVYVGAFGDQGWYSDDTRLPNGTDLVGLNNTYAGKPGQTATSADDAAIAQQIQFVGNAPDNTGALQLTFGAGSGGKATISTINTSTGFATGNWGSNFFANLRRYRDTETNTTIKIGIQSTVWTASQAGFTATRSGESTFDLDLTYVGNYTPYHQWEDVALTATSGTWKLYAQSGNSYFTTLFGLTKMPTDNKTLEGWASDSTWGNLLFGAGAKVTNVQIGAGSFALASNAYVDYLETSLLNSGDRIEFVPEPGTFALLIAGGLGLMAYAWRRRR